MIKTALLCKCCQNAQVQMAKLHWKNFFSIRKCLNNTSSAGPTFHKGQNKNYLQEQHTTKHKSEKKYFAHRNVRKIAAKIIDRSGYWATLWTKTSMPFCQVNRHIHSLQYDTAEKGQVHVMSIAWMTAKVSTSTMACSTPKEAFPSQREQKEKSKMAMAEVGGQYRGRIKQTWLKARPKLEPLNTELGVSSYSVVKQNNQWMMHTCEAFKLFHSPTCVQIQFKPLEERGKDQYIKGINFSLLHSRNVAKFFLQCFTFLFNFKPFSMDITHKTEGQIDWEP